MDFHDKIDYNIHSMSTSTGDKSEIWKLFDQCQTLFSLIY